MEPGEWKLWVAICNNLGAFFFISSYFFHDPTIKRKRLSWEFFILGFHYLQKSRILLYHFQMDFLTSSNLTKFRISPRIVFPC